MPRPRKSILTKKFTDIAQAGDTLLAEDCMMLLRDNDIEAIVKEVNKNSFMVQVEEGRFHEAYVIIQSHVTPEGFFDMHRETIKIKDPNQAA